VTTTLDTPTTQTGNSGQPPATIIYTLDDQNGGRRCGWCGAKLYTGDRERRECWHCGARLEMW
jgi:hypothetical protein